MDYLTASEVSKEWNISSRMVAYYCETGRIEGAIKKGKIWFIPSDSKKPTDKRRSNKAPKKRDELKGHPYHIHENAIDNTYHTSDVYHHLGLTRETLRYYEEIGLINPKRSASSQYREFNLYDMSHLMAIDFFKKRGFSPTEIMELLNAALPEEYTAIMQRKIDSLHETIRHLNEVLRHLEQTKDFYRQALEHDLEFTIRELPPYYVQEVIPSVASFEEYRDHVLNYLNLEQEDILSNMVRAITFDEKGYKTSGIYIVKPLSNTLLPGEETLLESGKCLYTTFIADNNDASITEKMFGLCHEWAVGHNMSFRGVVYIFIRFVLLNEQTDQNFYEVWIPLK